MSGLKASTVPVSGLTAFAASSPTRLCPATCFPPPGSEPPRNSPQRTPDYPKAQQTPVRDHLPGAGDLLARDSMHSLWESTSEQLHLLQLDPDEFIRKHGMSHGLKAEAPAAAMAKPASKPAAASAAAAGAQPACMGDCMWACLVGGCGEPGGMQTGGAQRWLLYTASYVARPRLSCRPARHRPALPCPSTRPVEANAPPAPTPPRPALPVQGQTCRCLHNRRSSSLSRGGSARWSCCSGRGRSCESRSSSGWRGLERQQGG